MDFISSGANLQLLDQPRGWENSVIVYAWDLSARIIVGRTRSVCRQLRFFLYVGTLLQARNLHAQTIVILEVGGRSRSKNPERKLREMITGITERPFRRGLARL